MRLRFVVMRLALGRFGMEGPATRGTPATHSIGYCVGQGSGSGVRPVMFFFFTGCRGLVPSELRAGRRVARWSGAPPTWAVEKNGCCCCWLIGDPHPPQTLCGVWSSGCSAAGSPVNFRGTRGSLAQLASVCVCSVLGAQGSRSRLVVAVRSGVGGSDSDSQPLGSISTDRRCRRTDAFA